jgi:hypothetical protein
LRGGVREARLIEFAERDRPGSERLVVALTLDVDSKDQLQKVVDSLSQEVKPVLGDIGYLDFMNLSEWEFAADIQDSIPPFFAWREE